MMVERFDSLPALAFGERHSLVQHDLKSYRDQLADVVTGLAELECSGPEPFHYKSSSMVINGVSLLSSCRTPVYSRTSKPSQPIGGLLLSGNGYYLFEGKRYDFAPGRIMYVPEGVRQAWIGASSGINVMLDRKRLCEAYQAISGVPPEGRYLMRLDHFQIASPSSGEVLTEHLGAIINAMDMSCGNPRVLELLGLDQVLYRLVAVSVWPELLGAPAVQQAGALDQRERAMMSKLRDYIHANLGQPLQLTSLAILAGTSTRRVRELFLRDCGVTPAEYIRDARLAQARQLLEVAPEKRIRDISFELGFIRASSFAAQYRQRFGESPVSTRNRAEGRYLG